MRSLNISGSGSRVRGVRLTDWLGQSPPSAMVPEVWLGLALEMRSGLDRASLRETACRVQLVVIAGGKAQEWEREPGHLCFDPVSKNGFWTSSLALCPHSKMDTADGHLSKSQIFHEIYFKVHKVLPWLKRFWKSRFSPLSWELKFRYPTANRSSERGSQVFCGTEQRSTERSIHTNKVCSTWWSTRSEAPPPAPTCSKAITVFWVRDCFYSGTLMWHTSSLI